MIDIVAVKPLAEGGQQGVLGIQCTSASNVSARVTKLQGEPRLHVWLRAGNPLQVWGWGKTGKRGARKTWTVRKVTL